MKFQFQFALLLTVSTFVLSSPFIANSKSALSNMRGGIGKLKISERKWYKYKEHCYYSSEDLTDWFTAENSCRKMDGYLVKFDEKAENEAISSNRRLKKEHYWIGLTDLKEGEYRWIYDQTKATFLPWTRGYGASGTKYNCVMLQRKIAKWIDYSCGYKWRYICESDHCY
ncbi:perlucin-like protein [Mytilus californianus]|uniref:perlucin-like protein n=1 Tax=Mytilus californianus TaxID=6549 RepID=UPI002245848A|nr:perlucin-like protein [Mytilus californianus]